MHFLQAMIALEAGIKMTRRHWHESTWIKSIERTKGYNGYSDAFFIHSDRESFHGEIYKLAAYDVFADDWEVADERLEKQLIEIEKGE